MIARAVERPVQPELFGLWLIEVLLCTVLVHQLVAGRAVGAQQVQAVQAITLGLTGGLFSCVIGLYTPDLYLHARRVVVGTALASAVTIPFVGLVAWMIGADIGPIAADRPLRVVALLGGWLVCIVGARAAFGYALRRNAFVRRVLIITADHGADAQARRLIAALTSWQSGFYEVAAVLPARNAGPLTLDLLAAHRIWGVVVAAEARVVLASEQMRAWSGCRVWTEPEFWERQLRRICLDYQAEAWQPRDVQEPGRLGAALNRGADLLLSLALLGFTLPLMLLTAVLVKLDSPGPVLFRQERIGLNGRPFPMLKFRSMRTDAEARGPVWASQRDPRVTRVGAFIRLARIDELPQLLNILRGEMSFIGPRPERPHFVEQLAGQLPFYRERTRVKPGLTGWAQVNYPYGASVEDARNKLSYDLYYIKHRGPVLDLLILFSTVRVVLFQSGAR